MCGGDQSQLASEQYSTPKSLKPVDKEKATLIFCLTSGGLNRFYGSRIALTRLIFRVKIKLTWVYKFSARIYWYLLYLDQTYKIFSRSRRQRTGDACCFFFCFLPGTMVDHNLGSRFLFWVFSVRFCNLLTCFELLIIIIASFFGAWSSLWLSWNRMISRWKCKECTFMSPSCAFHWR